MAERPIIFSAPMVRAILDGRKTMTRRLANLRRVNVTPDQWSLMGVSDGIKYRFVSEHEPCRDDPKCPFGKPGDILWVKETFMTNGGECRAPMMARGEIKPDILYRAEPRHAKQVGTMFKWTPSIYMPRWASRITLEVVSVKVERLQDISEADAKAEGAQAGFMGSTDFGKTVQTGQYRRMFAELWDSINGKREGCSWNDNPFVWVVEFRQTPKDDKVTDVNE